MRRTEREISDLEVIEEIVRKADVCRIALANNNIPYIVTMNFGYKGSPEPGLYFHCANEGRKLEMIRKNNFVCFEMDTDHRLIKREKACDFSMKYSSVVGWGNIHILTEEKEKILGLNTIMAHYAGSNDFSYDTRILEKMVVLRLEIKEITGKKC
jgi:nitroimidazol reductase NimA-like FMN-containing flavoprotein (pyridoxamine 5'-phosphate oxidase superfamily)